MLNLTHLSLKLCVYKKFLIKQIIMCLKKLTVLSLSLIMITMRWRTKLILSIYNNLLTLYHQSSEIWFYFLLKMLKCSHAVLEIFSEFSDIFRDIVLLSFYKIVSFFTFIHYHQYAVKSYFSCWILWWWQLHNEVHSNWLHQQVESLTQS